MKNKLKFLLKNICVFLLILTIGSVSASGHDIYIDVVEQMVTVKASYSDGKSVENADIIVYKANGDIYFSGITDDQGKYTFEIQDGVNSEELTVEVEQTGHKATAVIVTQSTRDNTDDFFLGFKVIAGIGYLLGIAGVISFYMTWKMKKK